MVESISSSSSNSSRCSSTSSNTAIGGSSHGHRATPSLIVPCTSINILPFSCQQRQRRGLCFQPSNKLYFPYEPGKQSTSAVRIMNVSSSPMAFKFQTTSPKSCFMRPPNGVLAPGDSIVASVVKFIELPKAPEQAPLVVQKRSTRDKFKIVSLKIKEGVEFTPDLFEEHKELVAMEQILQVVLLNPSHHCHESAQLKLLLAEADAAQKARKKLGLQTPSSVANISDINILEEWRQRKLARERK